MFKVKLYTDTFTFTQIDFHWGTFHVETTSTLLMIDSSFYGNGLFPGLLHNTQVFVSHIKQWAGT